MTIFTEDVADSSEYLMVVGNDVQGKGNISNQGIKKRNKDLILRYQLRLSLRNNDMQMPRKEEWFIDENMHVIRK